LTHKLTSKLTPTSNIPVTPPAFANGPFSPSPDTVHAAWQRQFRPWGQDVGYPIHVLLAVLYFAGSVGPIFTAEIFTLPVLACCLLRIHAVWPLMLIRLRQPLMLVILAWCVWMLLAMLWTPDPHAGWNELANARWAWTALVVYPVMERRGWFIGAICTGLALGNAAQALEWLGHRQSIDWLIWPHPPNPQPVQRISGWWHHPVMGGIILVGGLGLHLGPALLGRGWRRIAGLAGVLTCGVGALATGTRSAWLAAVLLAALVLLAATFALPKKRATAVILAATIAIIITAGAGWLVAGKQIAYRVQTAKAELTSAVQGQNLSTDMGARLQYAIWATEAIREHPVRGVGTGGYQHWVQNRLRSQNIDPATVRTSPQAHNTLLHAWATTGLLGALLCASVLAVGIWTGLRPHLSSATPTVTDASPRCHPLAAWLGTYSAGPTIALVGIAIVSLFDVPYVNIQPAAFTSALLALAVGSEWLNPKGWHPKT